MIFSVSKNPAPGFWDMSGNQQISDLRGVQGNRPMYDLSGANTPAYKTGTEGQAAQMAALKMYGSMANGGDALAEEEMRKRAQQNAAAGYGLAGASRGGNLYGMRQSSGNAASGGLANADQQALVLRAQQQVAARAGMGDLASSIYGQGLSYEQLAQQNAIQGQQNATNWYQTARELDMKQKSSDRQFFGDIANGAIGWASSLLGGAGTAAQGSG
jgi:hypothetical protein